jgi:hypothetical protein
VNRSEFQELSRIRLGDAKALLDSPRYDGAYYLAGYDIECALKACIAKLTRRYDFPPRSVSDIYSHDPSKLVKAAALDKELEEAKNSDPEFSVNWSTVKDWTAESRYTRVTQQEAEDLYNAITDRYHGVMRWLRHHW